MNNDIITIINKIDRVVLENDAVFAPEKLRRELALLENKHGREKVMDALCQALVVSDRRRQGAESQLMNKLK